MALLKRILRETVCLASLSFVCHSYADNFDISGYATQADVQQAAQDFVNTLIVKKPEFKYLKLDGVDGYQGTVTINNNSLAAIEIDSVKVDVSGVPIFGTYSPTIKMTATIASDCSVSNENYVVQRTNIALDGNFKSDLAAYGNVMFKTLANEIIANHPELNKCTTNNN